MFHASSLPLRVLVPAALLLSSPAAGLRAGTVFQWKFEKGQMLEQVVTSKATTRARAGGMDMTTTQEMRVKELWTVKEVHGDGSADIAQKTTELKLKMEVPMQGVLEYDSKAGKKIQGPLGQVLNGLLDAMSSGEVTFRLSADGQARDITLSKELAKTCKGWKELPQRGGMFSKDWFEQMFQFLPSLPGKAVAVGDSWERHAKMPLPFGSFHVHSTFTYKGAEKKGPGECAKIAIESTLSFVKKADFPLQVKLKSTKSTGEAFFDVDAGRFTEIQQTQELALEMRQGAGGPPIVSTTESKTKVTFKEKEPAASSGNP